LLWLAGVRLVCIAPLLAQAPNASVRGGVSDTEGQPVEGVKVTAIQVDTGFAQPTLTDSLGEYSFQSLPRGVYSFKVEIAGYRGLEKRGVELAIGTKHEESFILTRLSKEQTDAAIGGALQIVPRVPSLPGETVASSVSIVIEQDRILQLPLETRNIYSLFLLQSGVTSQGAIGARGLTFAVHGQRVSGSNYLLDGIDNNNLILTGPVAATSAEAIQEFRMVNSSFSSENGRATAFVTQVGTHSGSNRFRGSLFEFLANDKLNANTFESNSNGQAKPPLRRNQFGYSLGGPIKKNQTFFSSVLELSRLRYGTTQTLTLPTSSFIASLPQDSEAKRLWTEIPPFPSTPISQDGYIGSTRLDLPSRIDSVFLTERLDHHFRDEKDRLTFRYTWVSTHEERNELGGDNAIGYPDLVPRDRFRAHNALFGWTHSFDASRVNDFRTGWSRERIDLPRPHSEVAILQSFDGVLLPASQRQSGQQENNNVVQISDTYSARWGRSALSLGFDYRRNLSNSVSLGLQSVTPGVSASVPEGAYLYSDLLAFARDEAFVFFLDVDRFALERLRLQDLGRQYRSNEFAAFIQDDIKLSRRLSLNLGLRYEYYGVLHNTDRSQDFNFYFGPGSTIEEKVANGILRSTGENPGDLKGRLYRPDYLNLVPSVGLAWDPSGGGRTIVRVGYAAALDRVFDTLRDLRLNTLQQVVCLPFLGCPAPLLVPVDQMLPLLNQSPVQQSRKAVVQLDENLRTPYAQNWYIGVEHALTRNTLLDIGHAASVGRKLIGRDMINRFPQTSAEILDDTFLSNASNSNYLALEMGLRRQFSRGLQFQGSYTWSHAIDNQSDIFEGVRFGPGRDDFGLAMFTRQLDSRVDRGNASFDQRHNLVINAIWDLPTFDSGSSWANSLLRGWTVSVIGAYRSGFPVTVISSVGVSSTGLANNRVDLVGGQPTRLSPAQSVAGGVQWLNPRAFQPTEEKVGNLGRGAVGGPGFWNYDFALQRNVSLWESRVRLGIRAEFYNLFNHPNLSTPISFFGDPDFGQAFYGLNRTYSRSGALPLENPSRRIQFGLRIQF
jgi:hypothetical protein